MTGQNIVYIAASIDGFIADANGGVGWLTEGESFDPNDGSFADFMTGIDALVMGRKTFEMVHSFGDWPYDKPVFVLSNQLTELPQGYADKAYLLKGTPSEITTSLNAKGYNNLYIDGGFTVQQFLRDDLIDQLIINRIPVLRGGGIALFDLLPAALWFDHIKTGFIGKNMVQSNYSRRKGKAK